MNTVTDMSDNISITCPTPLLWNQANRDSRNARLYICIVALIIHSVFWLQLAFCSSVRQNSMQWIYAYLTTDILLLFRFFFVYVVRTAFTACEPSQSWILFICYFEATVDNYLNMLEVYILLALNICRYVQIVHNRNVYRIHTKQLVLTHVDIYVLSLLFLIVPFLFGWA